MCHGQPGPRNSAPLHDFSSLSIDWTLRSRGDAETLGKWVLGSGMTAWDAWSHPRVPRPAPACDETGMCVGLKISCNLWMFVPALVPPTDTCSGSESSLAESLSSVLQMGTRHTSQPPALL